MLRAFILLNLGLVLVGTLWARPSSLRVLVGSGASAGTLAGERSKSVSGIRLAGLAHWNPGYFGLSFGLVGEQYKLVEKTNGIEKNSTFNFLGPSVGWSREGRDAGVFFTASAYLQKSQSSSVNNDLTVNGKVFGYSILESYNGSIPVSARLDLMRYSQNDQLSRRQKIIYGISVSALSQKIDQVSATTRSSHPFTKPTVDLKSEESFQLTLATVSLIVGVKL